MEIVFFAHEAERRKERLHAELHRELVPWSLLPRRVTELETFEALAVGALARRCRIAVFDHFRTDRDEYQSRLKALDQALAAWESCQRSAPQRDAMLVWFQKALLACGEGSIGPMPELPDLKSLAPPDQAVESPDSHGPATPGTHESLPGDGEPGAPSTGTAPSPAGHTPEAREGSPTVEQPDASVPTPGTTPVTPGTDRTAPEQPGPRTDGQVPPAQSPADQPTAPGRGTDAQPLISPPRAAGPDEPRASLPDASALDSAVRLPEPVEGLDLDPPLDFTSMVGSELTHGRRLRQSDEPVHSPHDPDAAGEPLARRGLRPAIPLWTAPPPGLEPPQDPSPQLADQVVDPWPSAMLPKTQPRRSRPEATASRAGLPRGRIGPPPSWPDMPAEFVVDVDVADLAARVLGVNSALRNLEAELEDTGMAPEQWDAERLSRIVDRLENLLQQRRDLDAYRQLVSRQRRFLVPQLGSAELIVSHLGRRIFETRRRTAGTDFRGTGAQRRQEIKRLDELSRRLARLAAGLSTVRGQ